MVDRHPGDDQPRWPRGTPVAPGGKGPGGGRWRDGPGWTAHLAARLGHTSSLARSLGAGIASETEMRHGGHSGATITRIDFADGTWAVRKRYVTDAIGRGPEWQADSEVLASILADSIGVSVPEVIRTRPDEVIIRGVDGEPGHVWLRREFPKIRTTGLFAGLVDPDSWDSKAHERAVKAGDVPISQRRLGLFDVLLDVYDRDNTSNWFVAPDGETIAIDHANIRWGEGDRGPETAPWSGAPTPFAAGWTRGFENPRWASNPMTAADVAWVRGQLKTLRPAFEQAGRSEWLDQVTARFEAVAAHARGRPGADLFDHSDGGGDWASGIVHRMARSSRKIRADMDDAELDARAVMATLATQGIPDTRTIHRPGGPGTPWTPERTAMHDRILARVMERYAHVPRDRRAIMAGGLPGAGKTTTLSGHGLHDYMPVNPDDMKDEIIAEGGVPEVPGHDLSPMERNYAFHMESSYLADRLLELATADGRNILLDATMGTYDAPVARMTRLREAGYEDIRGMFVDVPVEVSIARTAARYRADARRWLRGEGHGGRPIPADYIELSRGVGDRTVNRDIFDRLVAEGWFAGGWEVHDNSGDGPRLVDRGV